MKDTIGQDVPIYLETPTGFVNATVKDVMEPLDTVLRAPTTVDTLESATADLSTADGGSGTKVLVLPADSMLWSMALTGLQPSELQCLEGNQGA